MTSTTAPTTALVTTLLLPGPDGAPVPHAPGRPGAWTRPTSPITSRRAFAAAHVVPLAWADNTPGAPAAIDWDATLAVRRELWSWGLGVADGMDTAQRGMGLDWAATQELVRRSAAEAAAVGGAIAAGAGTDQLGAATLPPGRAGLDAVLAAYREQVEFVAGTGATVVLMASRALARVARSPEDYLSVYSALLAEVDRPVVLHWLGPAFDPALHGYWGSADVATASRTVLELIRSAPGRVDGIKVSLLDAPAEVALRRALPPGVRLYTGDDHSYPELVVGDALGHSDALLGAFSAVAPAASTALQALDVDDVERARAVLDATQPLARHLFGPPTWYYKAGIAFLAWLSGLQPGFAMVGGLQSGRSLPHLVQAYRLADAAGVLPDPELAAVRLRSLLRVHGIEA